MLGRLVRSKMEEGLGLECWRSLPVPVTQLRVTWPLFGLCSGNGLKNNHKSSPEIAFVEITPTFPQNGISRVSG